MNNICVRSRKAQTDPSASFWTKVQRIFGEIPNLIRMVLEYNGFDSFLALKGIQWDDKKFFFDALEESIEGLAELDDNDALKINFREELKLNNQSMEKFKLKLGHKNLIINLCHELQKTSIEDFNSHCTTTIHVPVKRAVSSELVVRKHQGEEHGYSREEEYEEDELQDEHPSPPPSPPPHKRIKLHSESQEEEHQHVESTAQTIQYVYEDEDGNQFIDQEYIDDDSEIVEYQEVTDDGTNGIYTAEQIAKSEADHFEQTDECYEVNGFNSSGTIRTEKSKKPIHMYTEEFLQMQVATGRIGTPGRRRPKIQKSYPDTEEGLLERWADLVRQSCEVIVPQSLLSQYDLSHIEIIKILANIWEVRCPMCTKKLRLQLTHEGKYVNFKRSNFERHLRIVHYKQIQVFKPEHDEQELLEEIPTD